MSKQIPGLLSVVTFIEDIITRELTHWEVVLVLLILHIEDD